jgi:hypothetical protein
VLTTRDQWTKEPGALSDSVIKAIRDRYKVGWWGVSLRLYGRESVNKAAYGVLEDAMNRLKPMSLRPTAWKRGEPLEYSGWTGTPITFPMQNANWHGGRGGHIGFSRCCRNPAARRWRSSSALMSVIANMAWIIRPASPLASAISSTSTPFC